MSVCFDGFLSVIGWRGENSWRERDSVIAGRLSTRDKVNRFAVGWIN